MEEKVFPEFKFNTHVIPEQAIIAIDNQTFATMQTIRETFIECVALKAENEEIRKWIEVQVLLVKDRERAAAETMWEIMKDEVKVHPDCLVISDAAILYPNLETAMKLWEKRK